MSDADDDAVKDDALPAHEVPLRRNRGTGPDDDDPEASRKRLLLLVPLVMAAAAIVALVLVGMQDKGTYSKDADVLMAEKAKFIGKPVRVEGLLVHGSLVKRDTPCEYRFTIEKNGTEIPVRYGKCVVPDTFRDVAGTDIGVTVEGELRADNSLEASAVLAKCPSKYEMKQKAASGEKMPHAGKLDPAYAALKPGRLPVVGGPIYWIEQFAAQRGLRYEADADERWLRAWEPYTTLKVPIRYEHALHATGGTGSISIARAVVEIPAPPAPPGVEQQAGEVGTWIAIVQDVRMTAKAATTSDFGGVFGDALELASMMRHQTGDPQFDHVFASFAESTAELGRAVTSSIRKLLMGWRVPVHAEFRPGGFVLAPVSVSADEKGLAWMLNAVHLFGEKATKVAR